MKIDILAADSSDLASLDESAVDVARAIVDQLKQEINRLDKRGIVVLPATPEEQPISTEGWNTDEVLLRVVE